MTEREKQIFMAGAMFATGLYESIAPSWLHWLQTSLGIAHDELDETVLREVKQDLDMKGVYGPEALRLAKGN